MPGPTRLARKVERASQRIAKARQMAKRGERQSQKEKAHGSHNAKSLWEKGIEVFKQRQEPRQGQETDRPLWATCTRSSLSRSAGLARMAECFRRRGLQ